MNSARLSKLTIILGIFIVVSSSFMRQVLDFTKFHIGEKGLLLLLGIIFIIPAVLILISIIRNRTCLPNILISTVLLIIGITLSFQMNIPEERIHILEYAVLGWFAARDLIKRNKKIKRAAPACLFCIIIGISDELFQKILPYRVYDFRDIVFNSLGSAWGVILYLLSKEER